MIVISGCRAKVNWTESGSRDDSEAAVIGLRLQRIGCVDVFVDLATLHESDCIEPVSYQRVEAQKLSFVSALEEPILSAQQLIASVGAQMEGAAQRESLQIHD